MAASRAPRLALAALLAVAVGGCASVPQRVPPVLGGVPAAEVAALFRRWETEWRQFPGLRAAVDLVVSRDGQARRTAGALLLSPTHLRFEAVTPLGFSALVVTAGPDRLLVFSPGDGRAWSARPTAAAMTRWIGLPVEPAVLIRFLAGHVPLPPEGTPVRAGEDRGPHLLFERNGVTERIWVGAEGQPARVELEDGRRVTATFERAVTGQLISLLVEVPSQSLEAQLRYLSGEYVAPSPAAFELTLPPDLPIERVD